MRVFHAGTMFVNHGQHALAVADSLLPNPARIVGGLRFDHDLRLEGADKFTCVSFCYV